MTLKAQTIYEQNDFILDLCVTVPPLGKNFAPPPMWTPELKIQGVMTSPPFTARPVTPLTPLDFENEFTFFIQNLTCFTKMTHQSFKIQKNLKKTQKL